MKISREVKYVLLLIFNYTVCSDYCMCNIVAPAQTLQQVFVVAFVKFVNEVMQSTI